MRSAKRTGLRTALGAGAALLLLAGAGLAGEPIDRTLEADAAGSVSIENLAGTVEVTGWDRNEVEVKGTLSDDAEELVFERDGDRIRIHVEMPRRIRGRVEETDLIVKIPKKSDLEVETVSADIDVKGVLGALDLESVSGHVFVEGDAERVRIEAVSGSIEVEGKIPEAEVESVSGRVVMHGTEGSVEASTTSGTIEIVGGNFDRVSCESVSGKIEFEGDPAPEGEFHFECLSGSVVLRLPEDLSAEFEVETFSGSIDSDFGGRERRPRYGPGATFDEVYGKGEAYFSIETFSGNVRIRER